MVSPLTKKKQDGTPYTRAAGVEAVIAAALVLERPALLLRAAVADPEAPDFLGGEVLVHLIRKAHREGDGKFRDRLLRVLFTRCGKLLAQKLPNGRAANAEYLRDEVMGQFGEMFAEDGASDDSNDLDFFEIRFVRAFAMLRIDVVRKEHKQSRRFESFEGPRDDDENRKGSELDELARRAGAGAFEKARQEVASTFEPARQEGGVNLSRLLPAIQALPRDEREAVVLSHVLGYETESTDPTKETAATRAGVSGREIRRRLSRAAQKLSQFKEEP